jgi:hypothetical protein
MKNKWCQGFRSEFFISSALKEKPDTVTIGKPDIQIPELFENLTFVWYLNGVYLPISGPVFKWSISLDHFIEEKRHKNVSLYQIV